MLERPDSGTGSIERQSAQAKATVMLAKVHKVSPMLLNICLCMVTVSPNAGGVHRATCLLSVYPLVIA